MRRLTGIDPPPPAPRPWRPRWLALGATGAATLGVVLGVAIALLWNRGATAGEGYSLWRWEAGRVPSAMLTLAGAGGPHAETGAERLAAYFRLTSAIRAGRAADAPDMALLAALANERALLENDVERIVEGYVADAARAAGLARPLPLFAGVETLWPPVRIELANPPRLLVRSPRDRIERTGDTLLRPDLELDAIEAIEARADDEDTVSVVVAIGGLAAWPAIVREDRSYDGVLRLAAHEWIHHYLAFYPLGLAWGRGDGVTLNETVANVAERELARIARALHPVTLPPDADGRAPPRERTLDFRTELRALRLEVDALLAAGRVADAETLMEERRRHLAAHGIVIRKINQAWFAFYGSYADLPQSTDPIGPKVERVWEETGDLGRFLALVREVRSVADLDALLARLGVDPAAVVAE